MGGRKPKGVCDGCESTRALTLTDGGHWLCRSRSQKARNGVTMRQLRHEGTGFPVARHFFSKVVGVTHLNRDGSDRQAIVADCQFFEALDLVHEDDNPADPNAIAVRRNNGDQLGYLSASLAAEIVARHRDGYCYLAFLTAVTGGTPGRPTVGANLLIVAAQPGATSESVAEYVNDAIGRDAAILAELGADSITALPHDKAIPKPLQAKRVVGTGIDGPDLIRLMKEADVRDGFVKPEPEEPDERRDRGTAALARVRGLTFWCRQCAVGLGTAVDGGLRRVAGEGNDLVYRFLQILFYAVIPVLLIGLAIARIAR